MLLQVLVVGDGDTGAGGHVLVSAGLSSSTMYGLGGDIAVTGGTSEMSTGGALQRTRLLLFRSQRTQPG